MQNLTIYTFYSE